MNEMPPADWSDLAKLWQADGAAVSIDDIERHMRRERAQMLGVLIAEIGGLAVGTGAAVWLFFFTRFTWLGLVTAVFGGISAFVAMRMRREREPSGATDLLQSLKESIAREDWIEEQLRFGRALSFVALFAVIIATSVHLQHFHAISSLGLTAAIVSSAYVTGVLVWNLVLTRRARRRRARLEYVNERLKP
jgi:uncharacterized integral membrane protein